MQASAALQALREDLQTACSQRDELAARLAELESPQGALSRARELEAGLQRVGGREDCAQGLGCSLEKGEERGRCAGGVITGGWWVGGYDHGFCRSATGNRQACAIFVIICSSSDPRLLACAIAPTLFPLPRSGRML